jgi:antitoxin (DNA-binding transcriptional repressor) of toxin-antitoxin stability system
MFTTSMDVEVAAAKLREILMLLEEDTEILLTDGDKPLARIVRVEEATTPSGERIPDMHPGAWTSDDFNDPLPDEFWLGEA